MQKDSQQNKSRKGYDKTVQVGASKCDELQKTTRIFQDLNSALAARMAKQVDGFCPPWMGCFGDPIRDEIRFGLRLNFLETVIYLGKSRLSSTKNVHQQQSVLSQQKGHHLSSQALAFIRQSPSFVLFTPYAHPIRIATWNLLYSKQLCVYSNRQ